MADRLLDICVDGECLANGPLTCGGCKVNPEQYGELISRWSETVTFSKLHVMWHAACYYEFLEDAVSASNSMWETRERWKFDPHPLAYDGYTECGSSISIGEIDMADAIIIPLHRTDERFIDQTVCHHPNHAGLENRLILAEKQGYGDHPILWYRESMGIVDDAECSERFNGSGCEDSFHKDFFAQEIEFPNKSCLHKPPDCDEVYFFPADGDRCSARTEKGEERIAQLCQAERQHDARLAWEGMLEKDRARVKRGTQPSTTSGEEKVMWRAPAKQPVRVYQDLQISPSAWLGNVGFLLLGMAFAALVSRKKWGCFHLEITFTPRSPAMPTR